MDSGFGRKPNSTKRVHRAAMFKKNALAVEKPKCGLHVWNRERLEEARSVPRPEPAEFPIRHGFGTEKTQWGKNSSFPEDGLRHNLFRFPLLRPMGRASNRPEKPASAFIPSLLGKPTPPDVQ